MEKSTQQGAFNSALLTNYSSDHIKNNETREYGALMGRTTWKT